MEQIVIQEDPRGRKLNIVSPVEAGNIDLTKRPVVHNKDGSFSTVRTMSYTRDDGKVVNIPTVSDEGTIMEPREAIRYWSNKGQHLGVFNTIEEAEKAAQLLHEEQAKSYKLRGGK